MPSAIGSTSSFRARARTRSRPKTKPKRQDLSSIVGDATDSLLPGDSSTSTDSAPDPGTTSDGNGNGNGDTSSGGTSVDPNSGSSTDKCVFIPLFFLPEFCG